jgi:hypothetical protein
VSASIRCVEAEVREAFDAYEDALRHNDVEKMDSFFWNSTEVVRFGIADEQWGMPELRRWRATARPVPPGRQLLRTKVTVFDGQAAVVTTLFSYPDTTVRGRQSQTWFRFPTGWLIVNAHVSEVADSTAS